MTPENEKTSSTSFLNSLEFIENRGSMVQGPPLSEPLDEPVLEITPEHLSNIDQKPPSESGRISSSQRMKYDAEVEMIKRRFGSLEEMRQKLHLSQRKMAQLLMVDPSAWTRWTRSDGEAPPHIYRSLSWFLLLQEKQPDLQPYHYLTSVAQPALPEKEMGAIKLRLTQDLRGTLSQDLRVALERKMLFWKCMLAGQVIMLLILAGLCVRLVQN